MASADPSPHPLAQALIQRLVQVFRCHLCLVHCLQVGDAFLEEQKYNHIIIVKTQEVLLSRIFQSSAEFIVYRAHQPFRASRLLDFVGNADTLAVIGKGVGIAHYPYFFAGLGTHVRQHGEKRSKVVGGGKTPLIHLNGLKLG